MFKNAVTCVAKEKKIPWYLLRTELCPLPTFLCWSPNNPQYLRTGLYLEMGTLKKWLSYTRASRWTRSQSDSCPFKNRKFGCRMRCMPAEGRQHEDKMRRQLRERPSEKPNLLTPWSWTPELGENKFLLFKPLSLCGIFRWIQWGNKQKKKFAIEVDEDIDTSIWIFKIKYLNP